MELYEGSKMREKAKIIPERDRLDNLSLQVIHGSELLVVGTKHSADMKNKALLEAP